MASMEDDRPELEPNPFVAPASPDGREPSSWWLYFDSEAQARLAADALSEDLDCLTLVEPSRAPHRDEAWQVRAAKPVHPDELDETSAQVKAVTKRFQGHYDGWDSGWRDLSALPGFLAGSDVSIDDVADSLGRRFAEEHGLDFE